MNSLSKEELILQLKPLFKSAGFKKIRSTWYKSTDDLIFVFSLQGSIYGPEYYIDLGIIIRALWDEDTPHIYDCHIGSGIDSRKTYLEIFHKAIEWFGHYESIDKIKMLNQKNELPLATTLKAKEYLLNS